MARLLREELEPIFLRESKGFRVAREARTFFKDVSAWPQMDFLVQSSVHNCYDTISHELLVNELYEVLGKENLDFIVLLVSFLGAPFLDQEGQYSASARIGIPQGCPLSLSGAYEFLSEPT